MTPAAPLIPERKTFYGLTRLPLNRWTGICLAIVLNLIYFSVTAFLASKKLIWQDELFTLYIIRAGRWQDIWEALRLGADQHPPTFYWVTALLMDNLGATHVTIRLTAIAGFWVMCVCVYYFVARRTSACYGLVAALLPLVCTYKYAYEARGYGAALGCCGAALVLWQSSTGDRGNVVLKRIAIALVLALAVCAHYYAVLMVVPLAVGEIVRSSRRRSIDWGIWSAFAAPIIPIALLLPVIAGAQSLSSSFWGHPTPPQLFLFPAELLSPAVVPCSIGLVVLVVCLTWWPNLRRGVVNSTEQHSIPVDEVAAAAALSFLPALVWFVAITVTNGYHIRYALWSIAGFSILLAFGLYRTFERSKLAAIVFSASFLVWFGVQSAATFVSHRSTKRMVEGTAAFLEKHHRPGVPVVISNAGLFNDLSFYGPERLRSELVYVASATQSRKYVWHDTLDRQLPIVARWVPLNVAGYDNFLRTQREFYLYGHTPRWSWIPHAVEDAGFSITVVALNYDQYLLDVVQPPNASINATVPNATDSRTPRLPAGSGSLCGAWLTDAVCHTVVK